MAKEIIGIIVLVLGCVPYFWALTQWVEIEVNVDFSKANQIPEGFTWLAALAGATLIGTYYVTWKATRRGVYESFNLQKSKNDEVAKQLANDLVIVVERRMASWDVFQGSIKKASRFKDGFKSYDWSLLESMMVKIDLFSDPNVRQDIILLNGYAKDLERVGSVLIDEKNYQITACNTVGREFIMNFGGSLLGDFTKFKTLKSNIRNRLVGLRDLAGLAQVLVYELDE